uniref:Uncharacterized protein n=1 Tax=Rhizophora mucronata TaxID=61149 RepID=A0A2P2MUG2_RHIMU
MSIFFICFFLSFFLSLFMFRLVSRVFLGLSALWFEVTRGEDAFQFLELFDIFYPATS